MLKFIFNVINLFFIGLIRFYQYFISPMLGPRCRFRPTCSHYALESFKRYHPAKALWLTIKRISKCHPFHPGGDDPIK